MFHSSTGGRASWMMCDLKSRRAEAEAEERQPRSSRRAEAQKSRSPEAAEEQKQKQKSRSRSRRAEAEAEERQPLFKCWRMVCNLSPCVPNFTFSGVLRSAHST